MLSPVPGSTCSLRSDPPAPPSPARPAPSPRAPQEASPLAAQHALLRTTHPSGPVPAAQSLPSVSPLPLVHPCPSLFTWTALAVVCAYRSQVGIWAAKVRVRECSWGGQMHNGGGRGERGAHMGKARALMWSRESWQADGRKGHEGIVQQRVWDHRREARGQLLTRRRHRERGQRSSRSAAGAPPRDQPSERAAARALPAQR